MGGLWQAWLEEGEVTEERKNQKIENKNQKENARRFLMEKCRGEKYRES